MSKWYFWNSSFIECKHLNQEIPIQNKKDSLQMKAMKTEATCICKLKIFRLSSMEKTGIDGLVNQEKRISNYWSKFSYTSIQKCDVSSSLSFSRSIFSTQLLHSLKGNFGLTEEICKLSPQMMIKMQQIQKCVHPIPDIPYGDCNLMEI